MMFKITTTWENPWRVTLNGKPKWIHTSESLQEFETCADAIEDVWENMGLTGLVAITIEPANNERTGS
jgi:hypothetical protein